MKPKKPYAGSYDVGMLLTSPNDSRTLYVVQHVHERKEVKVEDTRTHRSFQFAEHTLRANGWHPKEGA